MEQFFTTMSFASSTHSKPHSNSLNFNWRSSSKNSILVIGDSPSDIYGAKNIGAIAAAALWDTNICQKKLVAAGAELQFREPKGLSQWLN
jgi:phosphoglycolate phosphatase-like HAD superfamily hydrolase